MMPVIAQPVEEPLPPQKAAEGKEEPKDSSSGGSKLEPKIVGWGWREEIESEADAATNQYAEDQPFKCVAHKSEFDAMTGVLVRPRRIPGYSTVNS